jgi:peptide/nickel transport system substrate-binding protein
MQRFLGALALFVGLTVAVSAQTTGPAVDKILFSARSQEDLGLMDVAAGKSDLWAYGTPASVFGRLPDDVKAKLDAYNVSGSSYLGLFLNPFPNQAPYLSDAATDASGRAQFNPLAIQKVRFALNGLINRQKVVDEILGGAGIPQFTPVVPGLPNSSRFDGVAAKLGITATGNEARALGDITAALTEASLLPDLKGRLVQGNPWWTFDGQPVTVRFVIRADDPNARLPLGRYIADQIEKAGIKVERMEVDRTKASATVNRTDPRTNQWNLYTEGLGSNETKAYWEMTMAYMYAPWASIMPGGNNPAWWNYTNADLDRLTTAAVKGTVKDSTEYWANLLAATSQGMKESVRILVAAKTSSFAAAKDRFTTRMAYGLGDGIDKWSFYTADVKPEASGPDAGKKVLRMTGFSAKGSLFMNAWDPVGPQGFGDTYSGMVIKEVSDLELEPHPATGIPMAVRATWSGLKTGSLPVPATAVLWNPTTQKWEPLAASTTAQATYAFRFGAWHHGRPVDLNDYRYALSFPAEAVGLDTAYASVVKPRLAQAKGFTFNADSTITVWSDAAFPVDQAQLASLMAPTLQVGAVNSGAVVPWEILEALKALVAGPNSSGTAWSFGSAANTTEVDLLNPKLVADLKAKLGEFVSAQHVPASLVGTLDPAQAVKYYQLTLAWLDAHHHAYISNGAFLLDQYDPSANTGVLAAFRDKAYPFGPSTWTKALQLDFSQVAEVKLAPWQKGKDLKASVKVNRLSYPQNQSVPAVGAQVLVTLVTGNAETKVAAKAVQPGVYEATLPAALVDGLKTGPYSVVAESTLGKDDAPGVKSTTFLKF